MSTTLSHPAQLARREALLDTLECSAQAHMALATRMLGNPEDAREVLQEAWLRAWRARRSLRSEDAARGWLRRIVVRECLRRLRWRKARAWLLPGQAPVDPIDPGPGPEQAARRAQRSAALRRAADTLSPRQRQVWGLRVDEQWSVAEIARSTQLKPDTVRTHLKRALAKITAALEAEHGPL